MYVENKFLKICMCLNFHCGYCMLYILIISTIPPIHTHSKLFWDLFSHAKIMIMIDFYKNRKVVCKFFPELFTLSHPAVSRCIVYSLLFYYLDVVFILYLDFYVHSLFLFVKVGLAYYLDT